jgi:hypothetical protein
MHSDRSQDEECEAGLIEDRLDELVLTTMLHGPSFPWTAQELARELQAPLEVQDAVRRLTEAGLVHGFGEFVFPTRAARRAGELKIGII